MNGLQYDDNCGAGRVHVRLELCRGRGTAPGHMYRQVTFSPSLFLMKKNICFFSEHLNSCFA